MNGAEKMGSHFFNETIERFTREQLSEWQNQKLRQLLSEITSNGFYQNKFHACGLTFDEVRSAGDLRALTFTTKAELVDEQAEHPPFGRLLTYPLSRYRYFHQTSGPTGR